MPTIALDFPAGSVPDGVAIVSVVAPDGTAVSLSGSAAWSGPTAVGDGSRFAYAFAGPQAGSYVYVAEATYAGVTGGPFSGTWPGDGTVAPPAGYYATLDDLYAEFGQPNVDEWSNIAANGSALAGVPTADLGRIQRALGKADDWVDSRMAGGRYVVPLSGQIALSLASTWAARYAGRYLFQARGGPLEKKSPDYTKYDGLVRESLREMSLVKAGTIRIDGASRWPSPTAPISAMAVRF